MDNLTAYIATLPQQLIMRITHDGQTLWIKRRPESKRTIWHSLQSVLSILIPVPLFKTTASQGGPQSLRDEAARFQEFTQRGIPVPDVIKLDDTFIVLSDSGDQLKSRIDMSVDEQRFILLQKATDALARLHAAGLCHGRPSVRDMTIKDDIVHFIDLEEDPTAHMSLVQAQARDAWLFFNGAARYTKQQPDWLAQFYATYAQQAPAETLQELHKMVRMFKPVRILMQYLIAPFAGKDVWQAVQANKALEQHA